MDGRPRVGVFGGTFDPPHLGHVVVAGEVVEAVGLDRLLWVPASVAPHKKSRPVTAAGVRRRMVEAAIRDDPRFELCDLELERGGVSYTVDTLRTLRATHPGWSLALVVGADLLTGFSSWKEPAAIAELAELVVMSRAGAEPADGGPGPGIRTRIVPVSAVEISSSRVRDRVSRGLAVRDMVAPRVISIIESERLYRANPARTARGLAEKPEEAEVSPLGGLRTTE